ncbi:MAG: DUF418 domain-containing protein [Planctomycetia bacterium]
MASDEQPARSPTTESAPARVVGYDIARTLALLGMIVVHFSLVAAADRSTPAWLAGVLAFLDGRAAATFVVLAGIGLTLMSRRAVASGDPASLAKLRSTFVHRGLFLLVIGFLNLTIWPGDILRVYGVSLLLASRLIMASSRRILALSAASALVFAVLVLIGDFEKNWDWRTLTYRDLWTPTGVVRNLFYDGFRSVLPWTGFILFGMCLGRLDLGDRRIGGRVLIAATTTAVGAEVVSRLLVSHFLAHPTDGLDTETVNALFGTGSMPALPLFLLAAGGTATAVITLCVLAATAWPGRIWQPFSAMGQLALTWYFAHIIVGLGTLVALGIVGTVSLPVGAGYGLAFFGSALLFSWGWSSMFRYGPLEWFMRRVAG